jgi:hypothetical protein
LIVTEEKKMTEEEYVLFLYKLRGFNQISQEIGQVRDDRSKWRDQRISERHRQWGFDCPATDIDFLLLEFSAGKAKALIEYKCEGAPISFKGNNAGMHSKSYSALCDLADKAAIPFFVTIYSDDFRFWTVIAYNDYAKFCLDGGIKF